MATKKKTEKTMSELRKKAAWGGFVDVALDDKQKKEIVQVMSGDDSTQKAAVMLEQLIGEGLKVSFIGSEESATALCTLLFTDTTHNLNYSMTSFGGSWQDALIVAFFKHDVILLRDWSGYAANGGRSEDFG